MSRSKMTVFWGAGLLVLGLLLLLQNLRLVPNISQAIFMVVFGVGGASFLAVYLADQERWWALIPGGVLAGIAAIFAIETFFPRSGAWAGVAFLFVLSLTFLAVFAFHPANWWALIPGGVLLTTAVVALLNQVSAAWDTGAIMMLGLAATFAALSRVETAQGRMRWPLIPATVLLAIGLVILASSVGWGAWVVALLLIVGGGYLVIRSLGPRE